MRPESTTVVREDKIENERADAINPKPHNIPAEPSQILAPSQPSSGGHRSPTNKHHCCGQPEQGAFPNSYSPFANKILFQKFVVHFSPSRPVSFISIPNVGSALPPQLRSLSRRSPRDGKHKVKLNSTAFCSARHQHLSYLDSCFIYLVRSKLAGFRIAS
jgi:hypothetical protein